VEEALRFVFFESRNRCTSPINKSSDKTPALCGVALRLKYRQFAALGHSYRIGKQGRYNVLDLALVPSAIGVARSQRSTSTVFTSSRR
jgi:hypothetical protein